MVKEVSKIYFRDFLNLQSKRQVFDGLVVLQFDKSDIISELNSLPIRTDYFGICLVRKGSLKLELNFKEYKIECNTLFFLTPMVIVQILECTDDIELFTLFTGSDFFHEIGLPIYKTYSMDMLNSDFNNLLSLKPQDALRFETYFRNLDQKNLLAEPSLFQADIIKMTLMLLFYEISDILNGTRDCLLPDSETKNKIVMDFFSHASKHFKEERSVQFYADQMHISRKHLSRVVKEITGLGPKAILDEIIIAEAVMLLNVSSMTVKDVMYELNFSDFGTFSKFFKSRIGKSPQVYRHELRIQM